MKEPVDHADRRGNDRQSERNAGDDEWITHSVRSSDRSSSRLACSPDADSSRRATEPPPAIAHNKPRTSDFPTRRIIDFQKSVWQRSFSDFPPLFAPSGV